MVTSIIKMEIIQLVMLLHINGYIHIKMEIIQHVMFTCNLHIHDIGNMLDELLC